MLAADKGQVAQLERRLQALRLRALGEAQDVQADRLLRVVEAMLQHTMLREADSLSGPYAAALNRMVNQVAGSGWKLTLEGQPADAPPEEPRFATWEEVLNKQRQGQQGQQQAGVGDGGATASGGFNPASSGSVADRSFYDLLGVAPSADLPAIKAAYRQLALRLHPDVNPAPDAAQRFAAVAAAYDVLSDAAARALYDRFGPEGMQGRAGAGAGRGNASRAWDEFKPFKRQNKHTQARAASTASYGGSSMDDPAAGAASTSGSSSSHRSAASSTGQHSNGGGKGGSAPGSSSEDGWVERWAHLPAAGAIVEYPLPQVVRDELQDGRSHGVGLLVGRNCDRGDARRLPEGVLDLCEVEPLRQQEAASPRWVPDELSPSAYVRLAGLRPLPVDAFDPRFDVWTITAPLSEGCDGPELGEEVIL